MTKLSTPFFCCTYEMGAIRHIVADGHEIIRMIYSAVRDHNWGTIQPEIIREKIRLTETGFVIRTWVEYRKGDIHFQALCTIKGNNNRLTFELNGEVLTDFDTNRTGLCILHPVKNTAGSNCLVIFADGSLVPGCFPDTISPWQPFTNISELRWNITDKINATLKFSGDNFEMEDQRNWTDASFKTYCRPLSLPFPYRLNKGARVKQKVILQVNSPKEKPPKKEEAIVFSIEKEEPCAFPSVGVSATSRRVPLQPSEAKLLKKLKFRHLRAEIKLHEENWPASYRKAAEEARMIGVPLFLHLCFSEKHIKELAQFCEVVEKFPARVSSIMVTGCDHLPNDILFETVFDKLKQLFPKAQTGSGVNAYFAELNRNRPQSGKVEFISFAACPQVHAFDDLSLVENLEGMEYPVASARKIFPYIPIFVSPVTLRQRFNVVASGHEPEPGPGELPPQVDPRQRSLFCAAWTAVCLKFLAMANTSLVTFYETVGWRGIIQGKFPPPLPEKFPAHKNEIFPVYAFFYEFRKAKAIVGLKSSLPLVANGIAFFDGKLKLVIASFSHKVESVSIPSMTGKLLKRRLGETDTEVVKSGKISLGPGEVLILEEVTGQ